MKNFKFTMLAVLSLSPMAMGGTYQLEKNESVSELLFNRLQINPIYRNGYLNRVLEHNNLTLESSRRLKAGTNIVIPDDVPVSDTVAASPEPTPETEPTPEPVADPEDRIYSPTPGLARFYLNGNAAIESMSGDVEPASFSSVFFYPQLKLGYIHETTNLIHQLEGGVSFVTFKKDKYMEGDNQLVNGSFSYQLLKKQNAFRWGLKLQGENTTMIVSTEDLAGYKLKNPFFLSIGPSFQWQGSKVLTELNLLYTPSQKVDKHNDLDSAFGAQLSGYMPIRESLHAGLFGSYSHNDVEETEITKATVGAALRWFIK